MFESNLLTPNSLDHWCLHCRCNRCRCCCHHTRSSPELGSPTSKLFGHCCCHQPHCIEDLSQQCLFVAVVAVILHALGNCSLSLSLHGAGTNCPWLCHHDCNKSHSVIVIAVGGPGIGLCRLLLLLLLTLIAVEESIVSFDLVWEIAVFIALVDPHSFLPHFIAIFGMHSLLPS